MQFGRVTSKANDTRTRNLCELTRARKLYMCHTNLQQDISRASFSHQIERVPLRASFSYVCHWLKFLNRSKNFPENVILFQIVQNTAQISENHYRLGNEEQ